MTNSKESYIIDKAYKPKRGRRVDMSKTVVRKDESIEDALRRFKRDVSKSGTLAEARKKQFYVKPSVDKKMRQRANRAKKK